MTRRIAWTMLLSVVSCILMAEGAGAHESTTTSVKRQETDEAASADQFPQGILQLAVTDPAAGTGAEGHTAAMRVSMEFQDANLKDILKTFSRQTGINVIAGGDVGDVPVTLYLEDVTVMDALDQILRASNLAYERPAGSEIYIVKPREPAPTTTITRVYRLKYARVSQSVLAKAAAAFGDRTPFEAVLSSTSQSSSSESSGGSGGAGSSGSTGAGGPSAPSVGGSSSGGGAGTQQEVGIDVVIKALLTSQGIVVVDGRTNSVVVTDVPENFPRLEAALAALDIRTPQILVDAEIIETSLTKLKDLGVEWGTGSEGDLVTLTPGSRTTRFPFSWLGEGISPSKPTAFSTSTLDFSSFKGVLQALENDSDTKILARPKVLTLDNEPALIRLTTEQATGFTNTSQSQTGSVSSKPERTTTGVVLVVTPQVNEHSYITMLVEPSVTKTVASQIIAPSGQATPIDPKTRSSRTMVRIKSGDTLVVGGLIDRSDKTSVRKVPVLGDLPLVGKAFKDTSVNNSASELFVFVTPRLLDEARASQVASAEPGPAQMREQAPAADRQHAIERTLNQLEQESL